jgi:hypothetical protein
MKLNYDNIKVGDIICTTSLDPIAFGIRIKEAGVKNMFNAKIATHVGIVVPIGPENTRMLAIAEMSNRLKINSLNDYLNKGYFGKRIVCIRRFEPFQEKPIQDALVKQIFSWWEAGKKYDYAGVLKYVFPFLKDKDEKFYCSEMLEWLALELAHQDLIETKHEKYDVMPYDIQKSKLLIDVENWR